MVIFLLKSQCNTRVVERNQTVPSPERLTIKSERELYRVKIIWKKRPTLLLRRLAEGNMSVWPAAKGDFDAEANGFSLRLFRFTVDLVFGILYLVIVL